MAARSSGGKSGNSTVAEFTRDWNRLRHQKHRNRGGVEARIITNLGFWYGEHYLTQARDSIMPRPIGRDEDKNKLFLVFNLFRKQVRRKIGRLWSVDPACDVTPNMIDPVAMDKADVANNLLLALDNKMGERSIHWKRLWWAALGGVVVEHTPWVEQAGREPMPDFDPETGELLWVEQQTGAKLPQSQVMELVQQGIPVERFKVSESLQVVGDVGGEIISPLNFFIDASAKTIRNLSPDQACYIAEVKTFGWIEEIFGSDSTANLKSNSDLSIVQTRLIDKGPSVSNINLRDLIPGIQGSRAQDDPSMAIVLTRYSPPCQDWPNGRRTILSPDGDVLDDDDCPYGDIPCTDLHWEPPETTFWTGDFGTDLIPGSKFLNKRFSQLGEAANAQIYETLLLGGSLTRDDIPTDLPGVVEGALAEDGSPLVRPMQRGELPQFFMESLKFVVETLESLGSSDLAQQRQFPGQLRGPLAIPMLQELLDSEDGPFFEHMGEAVALIKQMRLKRVKDFYPPIRTLHYNKGMKNEVLVFHKDDVLESGIDYTVSIDRSTLVPEISALRRARVREDLESPISIIYTNRRTGRIDPSLIAKALKYNDKDQLDREMQWRKLAIHFIGKLWAAQTVPPAQPFWDHNAIMDELEAAMSRPEWYDASPETQQAFLALYDECRQFLDQIQEAQGASMQSSMIQQATAQATQQAAAKAAAEAVDMAMQEIRASVTQTQAQPPINTIAAELQANAGGSQARLNGAPGRPQPPPNLVRAPGPTAMGVQKLLGR